MSNFSFSLSVFYLSGDISAIVIKFKIVIRLGESEFSGLGNS